MNQTWLDTGLAPWAQDPRGQKNAIAKRREHIDIVKASERYERALRNWEKQHSLMRNGEPRPMTPDPYDLSIAKRAWERRNVRWRNAINRFSGEQGDMPV